MRLSRVAGLLVLAFLVGSCGGGGDVGTGSPRDSFSPTSPTQIAPTPTASATASQSAPAAGSPTARPKGQVAPDFSLATFDGGTFRLSDFRNELPVILNFWAPW